LRAEACTSGTGGGGRVTGGAGGGFGGGGSGAEAPIGLTCLETWCDDGVDVADPRAGAEKLRGSAGRAARLRPRDKSRAGGESETTARCTSLVSGGTTGCGPSACGSIVRKSDDAQTEAPTVAKAGTRGPIRSTVCFTPLPAARRLALSTPRFSSAQSDGDLNAFAPRPSPSQVRPLRGHDDLRRFCVSGGRW
jgi:hypothetical protein